MEQHKLILGNSLEKLKELEDNSVDAVITDPPYHLTSIVKRFGKEGAAPAQYGKDGSFSRLSKGFMGKEWDGVDESGMGIAFNVDLWAECLRVLKPGGHLLAFSGTRTYHRMAVAIEDAGFEIRDMLEWVYSSGFPKSLNIAKVYDKMMGNKREVVGSKSSDDIRGGNMMNQETKRITTYTTKGNSPYEGLGTALKPAHESICMARKPLSEKTIVENVLKHGTGGLDIDGCRIPTQGTEVYGGGGLNSKDNGFMGNTDNVYQKGTGFRNDAEQGRFPANIICTDDALNDGMMQKSGKAIRSNSGGNTFGGDNKKPPMEDLGFADSGSKSRYFDLDVWAEKHGLLQFPKASKRERNEGLDKLVIIDIMKVLNNNTKLCDTSLTSSVKLARLLVGMEASQITVTAESGVQNKNVIEWSTTWFGNNLMEKYQKVCKSTILTKTQSITVSAIYNWLMHLLTNEYTADVNLETESGGNPVANVEKLKELTITISEKMALALGVKNAVNKTQLKISVKEGHCFHPTCKPVHLMSWLVRLVSKEGDVVLDPFMGSGTTGVACKKLNRQFIGIEMTEEYIPIAEARIKATKKIVKQNTFI